MSVRRSGAAHCEAEARALPPKLTLRNHLVLALVFLGALGIRGVYLYGQAHNNPLFEHPVLDGLIHHQWAQQVAAGEGWGERPFFRAPLYYHLLGLLYKLVGPSVLAARVAGCLLGAATCYLIARLGVVLAGYRVGVTAGVID
ncbi:MAG: hypothetical protein KKB50_09965, partial [Planctomycetes bacterium]|nr:hypothetical protein [Planctomycetota bacterium]